MKSIASTKDLSLVVCTATHTQHVHEPTLLITHHEKFQRAPSSWPRRSACGVGRGLHVLSMHYFLPPRDRSFDPLDRAIDDCRLARCSPNISYGRLHPPLWLRACRATRPRRQTTTRNLVHTSAYDVSKRAKKCLSRAVARCKRAGKLRCLCLLSCGFDIGGLHAGVNDRMLGDGFDGILTFLVTSQQYSTIRCRPAGEFSHGARAAVLRNCDRNAGAGSRSVKAETYCYMQ